MTRLVSQVSKRNFRTPRRLSKSRIPSLSSDRPSETPRHSSVSNINNDAFNQGFSQFLEVFFRDMFLEDSVQILSQRNRIPCIRPDNMIFRIDTHCPKHHSSEQRELSVRTFLYVDKLRTLPACIRLEVSTACLDATQCSISNGISFQNTYMGRQLQPSERCGFPSGRAHP
jgi:hypothetical protein